MLQFLSLETGWPGPILRYKQIMLRSYAGFDYFNPSCAAGDERLSLTNSVIKMMKLIVTLWR